MAEAQPGRDGRTGDMHAHGVRATGAPAPTFDEALRCPLAWYVIGAITAAVLATETVILAPAVLPWLAYPLYLVASAGIVAWIGRTRLIVRDGVLLVRGARLDLRYIAGAVPLDALTMRRLLGRDGDPAAFLATRAWIGPGVQILLDDPADNTPYWAVSTRHPRELALALNPRPGGSS